MVEAGLEDGSIWPSSRDCEVGAAKAEAVAAALGEVVVLMGVSEGVGLDPGF